MVRLAIHEVNPTTLQNLEHPVEVVEDSGRIVGRFFPNLDPAKYEGLECPFSDEEIARRKASKGKTYTTAEVLAHLEKL
jgi:hypothetical protein